MHFGVTFLGALTKVHQIYKPQESLYNQSSRTPYKLI